MRNVLLVAVSGRVARNSSVTALPMEMVSWSAPVMPEMTPAIANVLALPQTGPISQTRWGKRGGGDCIRIVLRL
jgi:hypothetical protein